MAKQTTLSKDEFDLVAIGGRMKMVRARLRKTQAQMAHDLSVSLSHYSKLEVGIGGMSHGLIYSFCRLFEVQQEWFLYGTGDDPIPVDPVTENEKKQAKIDFERLNGPLPDATLEKVISLALDSEISTLADQVSVAMKISKIRAMAILIKERINIIRTQEEAEALAQRKKEFGITL